jgi:two-component sensor histidine kinase
MATERAHVDAHTRVALLERQVALITGVQFAIHDAIAVRLAQTDASDVTRRDFHEFLRGLHDKAPRAYATGLVTHDGQLLASSHEYPATSRVEGRGYMKLIAQGEPRVVDRIILEQNRIDALVAASSVTAGKAPAAVVTAWPVQELARYMENLADIEGHAAFVLRNDGRLLVDSRGAEPTQLSMGHPILAALGAAPQGLLPASRGTQSGIGILAYSSVDKTPLLVGYEISTGSVRHDWLASAAPVWAVFAVAGVSGFVLLGMIQQSILVGLRRAADLQRVEAAEDLARHRRDLLQEMNHRNKNNLAMISSIVRIDARRQGKLEAAEIIGRLEAVAAVHDMLYCADEGTSADVGKLLEAIAKNAAIVPAEYGVTVTLDLQPDVLLDTRAATTLAMVVAEIITNSVKHAFHEMPDPEVTVTMSRSKDVLEVVVRDNGPGLPIEPGRRSGSELVAALALGAGMSVSVENDGGALYRLLLSTTQDSA